MIEEGGTRIVLLAGMVVSGAVFCFLTFMIACMIYSLIEGLILKAPSRPRSPSRLELEREGERVVTQAFGSESEELRVWKALALNQIERNEQALVLAQQHKRSLPRFLFKKKPVRHNKARLTRLLRGARDHRGTGLGFAATDKFERTVRRLNELVAAARVAPVPGGLFGTVDGRPSRPPWIPPGKPNPIVKFSHAGTEPVWVLGHAWPPRQVPRPCALCGGPCTASPAHRYDPRLSNPEER